MNKKHLLFGALAFPIFILLFFASLLGENHRATEIVQIYMDNLAAGNYSSSCIPIKNPPQHENVIQDLSCEDKNLIFMISLLSNFEFKGIENIEFKTNMNHYWIPFLTEDSLKVGLSYKLGGKTKKLGSLFIIKREGWSWLIGEIQITNQELSSAFTHYSNSLDLNKYVIEKPEMHEIKNTKINYLSLSPIDKMVLKYNLQKIYRHLE